MKEHYSKQVMAVFDACCQVYHATPVIPGTFAVLREHNTREGNTLVTIVVGMEDPGSLIPSHVIYRAIVKPDGTVEEHGKMRLYTTEVTNLGYYLR